MTRVGLVGFGFIGKAHWEAYQSIPNAEVVAICTKNGNENKLKNFDGSIVADYEELLAREDVDVVDICVPTYLHEDFIVKAAQAGKHIFCEKPLTLTLNSAERIVEEVEKAGVRLFVGHVLRFWPEYERMKDFSESEKLKNMEVVHAKRLGQLPTWSDWFQYQNKSGGALFDLHIHDIDFVYYLLGEVEHVYAVGHQSQYGAWNHIMTTLSFKNGAKAFVEASHRMPRGYPFTMEFRAQTKQNTLDFQLKAGENIDSVHDSQFIFYDGDQVSSVNVVEEDAFQNELAYFIHCLETDEVNEKVPIKDVLYILKLLKAIEQSLETGSEVKIL